MSDRFTQIEANILNETKASLEKHAKRLHLSIGEIIDRLTQHFSCSDPDIAANLLFFENLGMITKDQTDEQFYETIKNVVVILLTNAFNSESKRQIFMDEVMKCVREESEQLKPSKIH